MRDYCDAQAGFWLNSKFWSKFSSLPLSGIEDQNTPPPISENFRFGMTKVYSEIPPLLENFRFGMTKVYSKIPPISENFRFGMTKVYSEIPPPPFWKTSDLGWPKFSPKYPPPILENFRFGMTKVYSEIPPPHFGKLQIWDDQSLLRNTAPHFGKLQIWDDQSLLRNTPPHRKLSESPSSRFSEYRELLHVETLSNPDNY